MDFSRYQELVLALPLGKKLPEATYLHTESFEHIEPELVDFIGRISRAVKLEPSQWNLVKLYRSTFRISYLSYPTFFEEAYPALTASYTIDLELKSIKSAKYETQDNPPILHRKELFLPANHPAQEEFSDITREGEEAGLYANKHLIGFKQTWERLIEKHGYCLVDGRLFRSSNFEQKETCNDSRIDRHRTALSREQLSAPVQCLGRHGYLEGDLTLFDYGCGQGDDLRGLSSMGVDAIGWDPNFRPEADLVSCDLVNIGYVINVIEDLDERIEALCRAYELTQKILVVSAMLASESFIQRFKPFRDGVITSRNTFQKYFSQTELRAFIERILQTSAIPVASGVFFVFKDKLEEQRFLSKRYRRNHHWEQRLASKPQAEPRPPKIQSAFFSNPELCEALWSKCLTLGRFPTANEFDDWKTAKEVLGTPRKALRLLLQHFDSEQYETAQNEKREDLIVYFALGQFAKRKPYKHLPEELQIDIKEFFVSYNEAIRVSQEVLFQVSDTEAIEAACQKASQKLEACDYSPGKTLTFHKSQLSQCPVLLRIYVGCALTLYGDLESIDLIKIHTRSGKCSFMGYEGFDDEPIPLLRERIKVKLKQQEVEFFDYVEEFKPAPLYRKSLFFQDNHPEKQKQSRFEDRLAKLLSGESPRSKGELDIALADKGYGLNGQRLYKRKTNAMPTT